MAPITFAATLYLGDRTCKKVILDSWNDQVIIQVNLISRVRSATGKWEFYDAEDIADGLIVLSGVSYFSMNPPGLIPNNWMNDLTVERIESETDEPMYVFSFNISHIDKEAREHEVNLEIHARNIHLEDPSRPGTRITE